MVWRDLVGVAVHDVGGAVGVADDGDFHFATYIGEHHLHHHNCATYVGEHHLHHHNCATYTGQQV